MIWVILICAAGTPATDCRPLPDGFAYASRPACDAGAAATRTAIERQYAAPVVVRCTLMREDVE